MRIAFSAGWLATASLGPAQGQELLRLLRLLREHRSLRDAARAAGVSYRFAWGVLTTAARDFDGPLVEFKRGSGATLTHAGLRLLALDEKIGERLTPFLERLAAEFQPGLAGVASRAGSALLVHASHDLALGVLRDLAATGGTVLDVHFQGSTACLDDLARRRCDIAGFHAGGAPGEGFGPLRPDRHRVVQFALREQGLLVAKGARIAALGDLARRNVRFINRQKGSGTRDLFDRLLAEEGVAPKAIRGYADEEFTHLAVAATVAAGHADAGFGIRAAAAEYGLGFVPLATERYCLAADKATFESPAFGKVLALLGSRTFRKRAAFPGYDLAQSGAPLEIPAAGPRGK